MAGVVLYKMLLYKSYRGVKIEKAKEQIKENIYEQKES